MPGFASSPPQKKHLTTFIQQSLKSLSYPRGEKREKERKEKEKKEREREKSSITCCPKHGITETVFAISSLDRLVATTFLSPLFTDHTVAPYWLAPRSSVHPIKASPPREL
jgi:hypothetical protein